MTPPNPDPNPTITAILALLDAASAIVQLPADVRRAMDCRTVQYLLDNAKALDWLLCGDDGIDRMDRIDGAKSVPGAPDKSHESHLSHSQIPPTAQNAPKRPRTKARPPKIPAKERTPVLPPIPAATMNGNAMDRIHGSNGVDKSYPSHESPTPEVRPGAASHAIPFAEFDRLVRREMKRLAMDGRLPGHKLWDSERTPPLPTLAAVILRYQANGLAGLAETLGLEPPLSVQKKEESTL